MKKLSFLILSLIAALSFSACKQSENGSGKTSTVKKITNVNVEYYGRTEVDGTDMQNYKLMLYTKSGLSSGDDYSKNDIILNVEIFTPVNEDSSIIPIGKYIFPGTKDEENSKTHIIVDSKNTTLQVLTQSDYIAEEPVRINAGVMSIAYFKGDYEITGELIDVQGRVLEFEYYGKLSVDDKYRYKIDFESAELGTSGVYENILWGKEKATEVDGKLSFDGNLYKESDVSFGSYYAFDGTYDSWGGFAVSRNNDLTDKGWDMSNQFSLYAKNVTKFALGYVSGGWSGATYANPVIEFAEPVVVMSAQIANSNKLYHYCKNNPKVGEEGSQQDIWANLVVKGYKNGTETKSFKMELANGSKVLDSWKRCDFSSLGEVDKITFNIESNDTGEWGINVPTYFGIDNILIK